MRYHNEVGRDGSCRPTGYQYVGFSISTPSAELISVLILVVLIYISYHFMNTTVYDASGKRIPGPSIGDCPVSRLRGARRRKRVAELLHEFMINTWGDGKLCGLRIFGRKICFLGHPDDVKVILAGSHSAFPKAKRYDRLKFVLNEGLVTSAGKVWQAHRRIINKGFQATKYANFVKVFTEQSESTIDEIDGKMNDQESVEINLTQTLGLLSYKIICKAGFSYEPDSSNPSYSEGFSPDAVTLILDEINDRLTHLTDWGHYLNVPRELRVNQKLRDMNKVIFEIITNRRALLEMENRKKQELGVDIDDAEEENEAEKDLLDVLMRAISDEKTLSARDLRDHVFTFLAAGTETTATTTSWLLLELCQNQHIQEKCVAEIMSVIGQDSGDGNHLTYEDMDKLIYLEAVMKETLRLHPPISVVARTCKDNTSLASGYTLSAGTTAIVCIYSLHLNESLWKDANLFKPERFLPENIQSTLHSPWMYIPFAAGPRNCIGQRFAKYEVLSVVATFLKRFNVSLSREAQARYRVEETVVRRPVDLHMTFTKRSV